MIAMISMIMASTMVNVAIPDIMGAFGIGQDQAHWMSSGFLSAMTVSMLLNAWLVGRYGPRASFLGAVALFVLARSEEHTSELQSLMSISYAVFCLKKKKQKNTNHSTQRYIM